MYSTENYAQYFIITYKGKNLKKNKYMKVDHCDIHLKLT